MKKLVIMVMAMVLAMLTITLFAQPSKDALQTLKKIDATVSKGINFIDYTNLMAESNSTMREYLSKQTKNQYLYKAINEAWDLYILAKELWTNPVGAATRYFYPMAHQSQYDALMKIPGMSQTVTGGAISVQLVLPIIWSAASEKVRLASQIAQLSE
jgi:hypothetical protein